MLRLLYLMICLSFGRSETESSLLTRLPDIMVNFCPGVNVCRDNQTSLSQEKTYKPGYESCCTECSCELDCAERGNCCFPPQVSNPTVESKTTVEKRRKECLFPMTTQPKESLRRFFRSYDMISKVQEKCCAGRDMAMLVSCGNIDVAPWGSLYLVYSAQNRQIYKNIECAKAYNATDGILWDAVFVCDIDTEFHTDISSSVRGLESNSIPDHCNVHFVYQGDINDLRALICYVSPINTCSEADFEMPDGIGVSKDDVIELCTSGLNSPYKARGLYANVFCHICSGKSYSKDLFCPMPSSSLTKRLFKGKFNGLFDKNFLEFGKPEKRAEIPTACNSENQTGCRPLLCPSRQLPDKRGKCLYPTKLWYNQEYMVFLNLTTNETIDVNELFPPNTDNEMSITKPSFKSLWPSNWFITEVRSILLNRKTTVSQLVVILKNQLSTVRPRHLIEHIRKSCLSDWVLERGITYNLSPVLSFFRFWSFKRF